MNNRLIVLFLLFSITAVSHAQVRRGQKYSDWASIVHFPAVVTSFVFSSCDFVDRSVCPEKQRTVHEITRTNTNQNTSEH